MTNNHRLAALLLSVCVVLFSSNSQARLVAWGVNGMVVPGTDGELASHMPIFHALHDYPIVIALQGPANQRQQLHRLQAQQELLTLVPEAFDIERLLPTAQQPLKAFKVDLYRGHFERGGERVLHDIEVSVANVFFTDWTGITDTGQACPALLPVSDMAR